MLAGRGPGASGPRGSWPSARRSSAAIGIRTRRPRRMLGSAPEAASA